MRSFWAFSVRFLYIYMVCDYAHSTAINFPSISAADTGVNECTRPDAFPGDAPFSRILIDYNHHKICVARLVLE